ncbi:hypothetical protein QQY24_27725 [Streptomyces sp. TG1A-8]|uniref:hypothetical protein n=1 Tax=Streptomyces sp. TG1A-8 TaxID=3051385 RepID=UPI00265BF403|nr:hypothetical protein [Streptomyces sp. TG1A-8]MDO0929011.1 hypothetical protein [Streptomyces sp. TG1A-8]
MSSRIPNEALRAVLAEARWTGEALAAAVNRVGAEAGLSLHYRRSSVTHWLAGMRPRPPVPALLAEAFSRRLGRRVTTDDIGLGSQRQAVATGAWWPRDLVGELIELADAGARGEEIGASAVYSLACLEIPEWTRLPAVVRVESPAARPGAKVGRTEIRSAELMLRLFSEMEALFGGGHVRAALVHYLAATITPWLGASMTSQLRRELLAVAGRLGYLCGFACFDEQLHGAAQRYYRVAARMAAEAGDVVGYAAAARQMSVQAGVLGHRRHARALAETAYRTRPLISDRATRAFLAGQLAVTAAAEGHRRSALVAIATAGHDLEQADVAALAPVVAYHWGSLGHQHAVMAATLGDTAEAVAVLKRSMTYRPCGERRSATLMYARLAEWQLTLGEIERACDSWHCFLDSYPDLRSRRLTDALAVLLASTRPHQRNPWVRALRDRALRVNAPRHRPDGP